MKQAVLAIYIGPKLIPQSKFYLDGNIPVYQFNGKFEISPRTGNIVPNKLHENSGGIITMSTRIYDVMREQLKSRPSPRIRYYVQDRNYYMETTLAKLRKHAWEDNFGKEGSEHKQKILHLDHWVTIKGKPNEPFNLPVMELNNWLIYKDSKPNNDKPVKIAEDVMKRLKAEWDTKEY